MQDLQLGGKDDTFNMDGFHKSFNRSLTLQIHQIKNEPVGTKITIN